MKIFPKKPNIPYNNKLETQNTVRICKLYKKIY